MKSKIYNLIILDESGSMSDVRRATISGCNETLNTIRSAQEQFADTQEHYVSIYVFQDNQRNPSHYLIENEPIANVSDVNPEQYKPWGGTPLYDAIGRTLTDLKIVTADAELAVGNVTIITDGLENASEHYSRARIAQMIDALKEKGWSFNFIGANIDVKRAASSLNIDSTMEFDQTDEGTKAMFCRERTSRMGWFRRTHRVMDEAISRKKSGMFTDADECQMLSDLRDSADNYFDKD